MYNKRKILVIEDDTVLLKNIEEILLEENFVVQTAIEGNDGIDKAINWLPDLIICDIAIPNKNGYQVLENVSKNEKTKKIPFIFLTAKVEKEDLRKGMMLGADDYIFKPFDIPDLLNSIKLRLEKFSQVITEQNDNLNNEKKVYDIDDKILVTFAGKSQLCSLRDLKYLKAETPYIKLKFRNGKNYLQRASLNEWEEKLPGRYFIRIHRSAIINTEYISKIEKFQQSSYLINIKDEDEPFTVSKRFSTKLKTRFS